MVAGIEEGIADQLNKLEREHSNLQLRYDVLKVELHNRKKEVANLQRLIENQRVKIENLKKR